MCAHVWRWGGGECPFSAFIFQVHQLEGLFLWLSKMLLLWIEVRGLFKKRQLSIVCIITDCLCSKGVWNAVSVMALGCGEGILIAIGNLDIDYLFSRRALLKCLFICKKSPTCLFWKPIGAIPSSATLYIFSLISLMLVIWYWSWHPPRILFDVFTLDIFLQLSIWYFPAFPCPC